MVYSSISAYIGSKETVAEEIAAVQEIIKLLRTRGREVAEGVAATTDEYSLDDGQVRIRTKYRGLADIQKAIFYWRKELNTLINQYNGRTMVHRDVRGLH